MKNDENDFGISRSRKICDQGCPISDCARQTRHLQVPRTPLNNNNCLDLLILKLDKISQKIELALNQELFRQEFTRNLLLLVVLTGPIFISLFYISMVFNVCFLTNATNFVKERTSCRTSRNLRWVDKNNEGKENIRDQSSILKRIDEIESRIAHFL